MITAKEFIAEIDKKEGSGHWSDDEKLLPMYMDQYVKLCMDQQQPVKISNNSKPKKLIRRNIIEKLQPGEWEEISDQNELNNLYALKIQEELLEIQESKHADILEFVDLIEVSTCFAQQNGFTKYDLSVALSSKAESKGIFGKLALNNLNPENPSNKLYFTL